jgi:hypothetical protein
MPRHERPGVAAPVVVDEMDVAVAEATVADFNLHV